MTNVTEPLPAVRLRRILDSDRAAYSDFVASYIDPELRFEADLVLAGSNPGASLCVVAENESGEIVGAAISMRFVSESGEIDSTTAIVQQVVVVKEAAAQLSEMMDFLVRELASDGFSQLIMPADIAHDLNDDVAYSDDYHWELVHAGDTLMWFSDGETPDDARAFSGYDNYDGELAVCDFAPWIIVGGSGVTSRAMTPER